jgi:hypothetical protein
MKLVLNVNRMSEFVTDLPASGLRTVAHSCDNFAFFILGSLRRAFERLSVCENYRLLGFRAVWSNIHTPQTTRRQIA